ncbi:hypothetical protein PZH42_31220, partial [Bacteroides cellulosilyticus]|nr:hypothetical protein [Bacteroides cellulosilyticus]
EMLCREQDCWGKARSFATEKEKELYTKLFGSEYLERVYNPMKEYAAKVYKDKTKGKRILELYSIKNNNTEILFMERCINLLKPGIIFCPTSAIFSD